MISFVSRTTPEAKEAVEASAPPTLPIVELARSTVVRLLRRFDVFLFIVATLAGAESERSSRRSPLAVQVFAQPARFDAEDRRRRGEGRGRIDDIG
jgi:hypothetical protein